MCLAFPVIVCAVLIISPKVTLHDTLSVSHRRIHLQAVLVTICYPLPVTTQGWREGGVEGHDFSQETRLLPRVSPGLTVKDERLWCCVNPSNYFFASSRLVQFMHFSFHLRFPCRWIDWEEGKITKLKQARTSSRTVHSCGLCCT